MAMIDITPEGLARRPPKKIKVPKPKPLTFKQKAASFSKSVSRRGSGFLDAFANERRRVLLVNRRIRSSPISSGGTGGGIRYGKRGRPKGSFDPRYASVGGVYEYRKRLNAQLRIQKLQALRDSAINPRQQAILAQIEARNQAIRQAPENQTIPDVRNSDSLASLHKEIEDAARIID